MTADIAGIVLAALGGAAVGVERQRSGHASGPASHFAGVRTFTLLGGLAGTAGWLWANGFGIAAAVLLIGAVAIIVTGYIAVSRLDTDATTEVAALIVLASGVLSGIGRWELASGIVVITALLLVEKSTLHSLVHRIPDEGLRAGFRFALMAVVILPLLPEGPYGPFGGIRPRELWILVLLFSGISFLAYIVRSFLGPGTGYVVAGLLGGLISSTNVTFTFSRMRAENRQTQTSIALGVVAASTMLYFRVFTAATILNPTFARELLPFMATPALVGVIYCVFGLRRTHGETEELEESINPLQFRSALQMAVLFQVVLTLVKAARGIWGETGLLVSGGILGLTDVDALVISMSKAGGTAALATTCGILSNNMLKLGVVIALGKQHYRTLAASGLAALVLATALSLLFFKGFSNGL